MNYKTTIQYSISFQKLFESDWSRICETSKYIFDKYLSHGKLAGVNDNILLEIMSLHLLIYFEIIIAI